MRTIGAAIAGSIGAWVVLITCVGGRTPVAVRNAAMSPVGQSSRGSLPTQG